jgi:hypothetical protein
MEIQIKINNFITSNVILKLEFSIFLLLSNSYYGTLDWFSSSPLSISYINLNKLISLREFVFQE